MPTPEISINYIKINDKKIAVIKVKKSKRFVSLGNIAYIRIGRGNKALDIEELAILSVEEMKISFDEMFSDVSVEELNKSLLKEYLQIRKKMRNVPVRGSIEENIKKLGIEKNNKLNIAGVLFFTDNPQKYFDWTGIRVIELYPDGETKEIKEFKGPLWKMIDDVYNEVIKRLPFTEIRVGTKREKILLFPEEAIREAIINAVAHRNYRIRTDIRIFIKHDSLVIKNPGSFPPGVTPDNPEHIARNPKICQFLYEMGYIERYGYGIIRMKEAVKNHPFATLEFNLGPMYTEVIFKSAYRELNEAERLIIALLRKGPKTSTEIAQEMNMSKVAVLRKLENLLKLGVIKKSGKGKKTRYSLS